MSVRLERIEETISRILIGSMIGCVLIFCVELILVVTFGLPINKSDERWNFSFLFAQWCLPVSIVLGSFAGKYICRTCPFQISRFSMAMCCLAIALISTIMRPVVDRVPRPGSLPPMFELIPDTITQFSLILAVVFFISNFILPKSSQSFPAS